MRSIVVVLSLLVLFVGMTAVVTGDTDAAVVMATENDVKPLGGGEYTAKPIDDMSEQQRAEIQSRINLNIARLEHEGKLPPMRPDAVPLSWPVKKAVGFPSFDVDAISNYVDHNAAFPNQLRDWNCGTRTYDLSSGYNHKGIDIFLWPYSWLMMDQNGAEIVAAAPGTIILKDDGNFDRSCGLNSNPWNAVFVRHSDNSVAWYGHMKNGSTTTKQVGESVVAGEKLGLVGSSGSSTGPHLHFELYNGAGQLEDPFQGTCNTMNANSWWQTQPTYRIPRLNALTTGSAAPASATCPNPESPNLKSTFAPGEVIFTTAYYRDQLTGSATQYSLVRPDGTLHQTWGQTSQQNYDASWWWWSWQLPTNAPTGNWKLRAVFNGNTFETPFVVATPTATISGRVTTPTGQNLRNAVVSLIDANNVRRNATTSSFGLYSFDNVAIGGSYTMTVSSKRFRFTPQVRTINGNLSNVDFIGLE